MVLSKRATKSSDQDSDDTTLSATIQDESKEKLAKKLVALQKKQEVIRSHSTVFPAGHLTSGGTGIFLFAGSFLVSIRTRW